MSIVPTTSPIIADNNNVSIFTIVIFLSHHHVGLYSKEQVLLFHAFLSPIKYDVIKNITRAITYTIRYANADIYVH